MQAPLVAADAHNTRAARLAADGALRAKSRKIAAGRAA